MTITMTMIKKKVDTKMMMTTMMMIIIALQNVEVIGQSLHTISLSKCNIISFLLKDTLLTKCSLSVTLPCQI